MAKLPNDPLREAIALAYSQTDTAPRVVARGKGVIAEKIIARAQEHGVYVHESPELVALLTQVDIDEHIPPQLYMAIAESSRQRQNGSGSLSGDDRSENLV